MLNSENLLAALIVSLLILSASMLFVARRKRRAERNRWSGEGDERRQL